MMRGWLALIVSVVAFALPSWGVAADAGGAAPGWSPARHLPSAMPLETWRQGGRDLPFDAYVAATRAALDLGRRAMEPDPTLRASHVERVAPRQWPLAAECGGVASAGVLLVHGLSDSPFTMADVGESLAGLSGRCLLVRSILLPGHGSVPGDLMRPTAAQWKEAVRYGVQSFAGVVGRVHLVGFSTGAALALDLVLDGAPTDPPMASLVLLSPSIGLLNRFPLHRIPYGFEMFGAVMRAFSGFAPSGDWLRIDEDLDFAKAESFPVLAPRPLMEVMGEVERSTRPLTVPVFMSFAAEDATVDAQASLDFFRARVVDRASRLLLYATPATLAAHPERFASLDRQDGRITCLHGAGERDVGCIVAPEAAAGGRCAFGAGPGLCISSLSHIALPIAPANPHYGVDGDYRNCLAYSAKKDWGAFCACVTPGQRDAALACRGVPLSVVPDLRLGEVIKIEQPEPNGGLVARLGYNPTYDRLISAIAGFLP